MMSNNWVSVPLGDLLNFRRGHDLSKNNMVEGEIPVVGSNGIIGYHNVHTTKAPSISIGRSGNVGNPFYINQDTWSHNTCLYIDDFKGNNEKYIYYLLCTLDLKRYGGGSAVPTLNRNHIHPLIVNATLDKVKQEKIANILSSLDDKIENNKKTAEKLEEIAQTLFNRWFVEFNFPDENGLPYKDNGGEMVESELGLIPKGWEVCAIGTLSKVVSKGTTPRKIDIDSAIDENSVKFLKVKDISDNGLIDIKGIEYIPLSVSVNQLKRSILQYKDILISIAGTIGRVSYVNTE